MIKAELKLECKNCINDISIDIIIDGKSLPSLSSIMKEAEKQGWKVGRDCYCPECYEKLMAHCQTCQHYEGCKSMGAYVCRKDGLFAMPHDFCSFHDPNK